MLTPSSCQSRLQSGSMTCAADSAGFLAGLHGWMGEGMRVVRVLGKLEPGGAQLALLRLMRGLERRYGVRPELWVGDATADGIRMARHYGVRPAAFRTGRTVHPHRNLQWQLSDQFATWLAAELPEADLVHAHMLGAWWAAAQAISSGTPLVATEHNQVNWSARRIRSLNPAACRVDRFFAMGPAAARFAALAGVPPAVVRPARSPVEGLRARPVDRFRSPRLTFAGRLSHDKGADLLIEAIGLLGKADLSCYLLGDGPLSSALTARVEKLHLADQVFFPGWVDRPWIYIAGSCVHIVPSREEAWSQSAVLALGLGVPVIGTEVDGLAETLGEQRGVLVPPEDPVALSRAIAGILRGDLSVRQRAARRYAQQFTAGRVSDFYYTDYQALLQRANQYR